MIGTMIAISVCGLISYTAEKLNSQEVALITKGIAGTIMAVTIVHCVKKIIIECIELGL